jgi:rod shape-determining protein MreC
VLRAERIPFAGAYTTVVADVIDQPSSNLEETITIGKGTSEGVAVGQPVVTAGSLAGKVASVTSNSATVTLISDPQLQFGVALPAGNVGTADSAGPGQGLDVSVIPTARALPRFRKGDRVYTTNLDLDFPPGIPVGTISSVRRSASGATPDVTVKPYGLTANLSYVTVLLWSPS